MVSGFSGILKVLGAVLLLFLHCQQAEAERVEGKFGKCSTVTPATLASNPLVPAAGGAQIWHEIRRFKSLFEDGLRCVTDTFNSTSNTTVTMSVVITGKTSFGRTKSLSGTLISTSATNFGSWNASFSNVGFHGYKLPTTYTIVAVDPAATWVVIYTCLGPYNENSWILSTVIPMTQAKLAAALAAAQVSGVDICKYVATVQNC